MTYKLTLGLRRSASIPAIFSMLSVSALVGCSSAPSPSGTTPPVKGSISIAAPTDGALVKTLPLTLQLTLSGAATLSSSSVTINGQDVTKTLVVDSSGNAQATVGSSYVYVGANRIQATFGSQVIKATFTFDPTTPDFKSPELTTTSATGGALNDVIPIQTRVQMTTAAGSQGWGIQIGSVAYPQSTATANGFQVLLLNRADLTLVSNTDYPINVGSDADNFASSISAQSAFSNGQKCPASGCLEIIQSLSTIGNTSCVYSQPLCVQYRSGLGGIGGTGTLGQANQLDTENIAYSFIGNVGSQTLHAGSNFERVTCSSSRGCLGNGNPSDQQVLNGIVPNGKDGTQPTLANTGGTGFTTVASTATMPQMQVSNNGAMAGELVLDNNNFYTFTYAEPPVHFAMGVATTDPNKAEIELSVPSKSSFRLYGGVTIMTGESAQLPANKDGSRVGGFLLTAYDAVTFQNLLNSTFTVRSDSCTPINPPSQNFCYGPDGTPVYGIDQLPIQIQSLNSRRVIFFLQSIGNLNHNATWAGYPPNNNYNSGFQVQDLWNKAAQGIQDIGGTYATFVSLNNPAYANDNYDQYLKNTVPFDDYFMVGQWWLSDSGVANPNAKEESSQINRQTIKSWGGSRMTGLLQKERDGYFRASLESEYGDFFPKSSMSFFAAPTMLPVSWPLTGPNDPASLKSAYQWVSQQLLGCINGCNDVRAAYNNLNQDPAIWLAVLTPLQMPEDCATSACGLGFSSSDFETAKTQLITELRYLGSLREFRSNLVSLLQAQQANQSLILQQELDSILSNTSFTNNSSSYGVQNWRTWLSDAAHIAGPAIGLGVGGLVAAGIIASGGTAAIVIVPTAGVLLAVGVGVLDLSAKKTNNTNGASLEEQEHELIAGSRLAGRTADQYSDILTSVGHDFDRIGADWGRLSAIGTTLAENNLVWDADATGKLLKTFDVTARRNFVQTILQAGYQLNHYRYASPGINTGHNNVYLPQSDGCTHYNFMAYQAAGDPTDPGTRQSYASYLYLPGAPIDGPGYTIQNTANTYPFDIWWDVWTMTEQAKGFQGCTNTNNMPTNSLFLNTGMFTPLDPADPNALGLYKVWLYQRDFAGSISQIESPSDAATFWNNQSNINFHFGSGVAPLDPDSY